MKLVPDTPHQLSITSLGQGWISVNGVVHEQNIVLTASGLTQPLKAPNTKDLAFEDFHPLIAASVEVVLIGTGQKHLFLGLEILAPLMSKGIGFEFMDTPAACRTFNILANDGRNVGAILFID